MASKGILIGKLIYSTIISDSVLLEKIANKTVTNNVTSYSNPRVYPIVAPNETIFPFIVYTRTNLYPSVLTKDGWSDDKVSFQITIASETYNEGAEMANEVRTLFENCKISNDELIITNIRLTNVNEMFQDDTFIQNLYFECESI